MLAEAEISSGRDVGIVKSLRSQLKDGPILVMEVSLRTRRITRDVLNSDSAGFAHHLLDYLAGGEYARGQDQAARDAFSVLAPPRGEIPVLPSDGLGHPMVEALAVDALISFGMASALRGAPDPAMELQKNLLEIVGETYPGKALVDKWRGADVPLAPLDKVVSEAIALMRSDMHSPPRGVWGVGLRLFEKQRQSNFRMCSLRFWRIGCVTNGRELLPTKPFDCRVPCRLCLRLKQVWRKTRKAKPSSLRFC
jgi:hypothetical protein